jgi:DNA-binding CsgD family transcriptional regulator
MQALADYLGDLAAAASDVEERQVLTDHLTKLGVGCFAYVNLGRNHIEPYYATTYPLAWMQRYAEQSYIDIDPVPVTGRRSFLPFRWLPLLDQPRVTAQQRLIFDEAREFGLTDGMAIPIQGIGLDFALISFAVTADTLALPDLQHNIGLLHLMTLHFHAAVEKRVQPDPLAEVVHLTPRETECLKWMSKGKTAWEISQILHISERTAVYHIENTKRKLGVNTRNHAVVKAISLGLVDN